MLRLSYDLHVHSCLSPCADNEMTPANIAGMAFVKGLDVIALTDHNTCRNCPAFIKHCNEYGILAIPGLELTTMEEVHVLCLFEELSNALDFDNYVYGRLMKIPNNEKIFGSQIIYGEGDEPMDREESLLINATSISFNSLYDTLKSFGGTMVPAHIERPANSLLANLGFISRENKFKCAEVKGRDKENLLKRENPYLKKCRIIYNSDAHSLGEIKECEDFIFARERNIKSVLEALEQCPPG